jgi:carbonic anhydrase/acetyltransferase-like protein (isoleucine patch superfamily)
VGALSVATILEYKGKRPRIDPGAFIAPTATLVGDVRVADGASIWFGAVLRADESYIEIGTDVSIQDNVVIHCAPDLPTLVRARATVGHAAVLEGCIVEEEALIGMSAVVLHHACVGAGTLVAAGAVVPERMVTGPSVLVAGVPARVKRPLTTSGRAATAIAADKYQELVAGYRESGTERRIGLPSARISGGHATREDVGESDSDVLSSQ